MAQRRFSRRTSIIDELASRSGDAKRYAQTLDSKDRSFSDWIVVGSTNAPAFANGWIAGADPLSFIRNSAGWVQFKGLTSNGALTAAIFTLPAGFRPLNFRRFAVISNDAFGYAYVGANGNVVLQTGSNAYADLAGISFRAEQ